MELLTASVDACGRPTQLQGILTITVCKDFWQCDPPLPPMQGPFVLSLHSLQQTISSTGQRLENNLHMFIQILMVVTILCKLLRHKYIYEHGAFEVPSKGVHLANPVTLKWCRSLYHFCVRLLTSRAWSRSGKSHPLIQYIPIIWCHRSLSAARLSSPENKWENANGCWDNQ